MNKKKITKVLLGITTLAILGVGFIGSRGQTGQIDPPFGYDNHGKTRGQTGIDPPFGFILPNFK